MTIEQLAKAKVLAWDIDRIRIDLEDLKANGLNPNDVKQYLEIDWLRDVLTHTVIKATEERLAEKEREFAEL